MAKYIDANKVIDYANQEVTAAFYYPQDIQEQRKQDEQAYRDKWAFVKQVMVSMPAADVIEIRRERWVDITKDRGHPLFKCSGCGDLQLEESYYCPNCGALMVNEDV